MTRILIGIKTNKGGAWLVPIVAALVTSGCRVLCCVADEEGQLDRRLREVGAEVVRTSSLGGEGLLASLRALPRLARLARSFQPDVVNYHLYRSALVFRLISVAVPRARRVHAVPGPLFLEQPIVRAFERVLARRDDVIVCTSNMTRRLYRSLGIRDERLCVTPYPIDLEAWRPTSSQERARAQQELGLVDTSFVAVMVAYYYPPRPFVLGGAAIKGHDVAIAAWRNYRRRGGTGTLLLVGGGFGPHGAAYRTSLLSTSGAMEDPSIVAIESVDDVRPYYAAADVSLAPSRSENLGSAAEASALGVPTIASEVGGLPELVLANVTGWLVPPTDVVALADALAVCSELVRDHRIERFGLAAREQVDLICGARAVVPTWTSILQESVTSTSAPARAAEP